MTGHAGSRNWPKVETSRVGHLGAMDNRSGRAHTNGRMFKLEASSEDEPN